MVVTTSSVLPCHRRSTTSSSAERSWHRPSAQTNQASPHAGGPDLRPGVVGIDTNGATFGGQISRPAATGTRTIGQFGGNPGVGGEPAPLLSHNPLQPHVSSQNPTQVRQPFVASERSLATSERANSVQEVEELLGSQGRRANKLSGCVGRCGPSPASADATSSSGKRPSGTFRPEGRNKQATHV